MIDVQSYRQYAADCVLKAQDEESPDDRNLLLNVALAWLRLAQQTQELDASVPTVTPAEDDLAAEAR